MTTPTNWPNPERPGVPPNPERDGLYAMRIDEKFIVRYWTATRQHYSLVPGWENGISPSDASVFTFCGEILTPTQISEMLAAERERIITEALPKILVDLAELPDRTSPETAPDLLMATALEVEQVITEEIRNLGAAP